MGHPPANNRTKFPAKSDVKPKHRHSGSVTYVPMNNEDLLSPSSSAKESSTGIESSPGSGGSSEKPVTSSTSRERKSRRRTRSSLGGAEELVRELDFMNPVTASMEDKPPAISSATKPATPAEDLWVCRHCNWTYPNAHPSAKHRRNHKKQCGKLPGLQRAGSLSGHGGSSDDISSGDDSSHKKSALHKGQREIVSPGSTSVYEGTVVDVPETVDSQPRTDGKDIGPGAASIAGRLLPAVSEDQEPVSEVDDHADHSSNADSSADADGGKVTAQTGGDLGSSSPSIWESFVAVGEEKPNQSLTPLQLSSTIVDFPESELPMDQNHVHVDASKLAAEPVDLIACLGQEQEFISSSSPTDLEKASILRGVSVKKRIEELERKAAEESSQRSGSPVKPPSPVKPKIAPSPTSCSDGSLPGETVHVDMPHVGLAHEHNSLNVESQPSDLREEREMQTVEAVVDASQIRMKYVEGATIDASQSGLKQDEERPGVADASQSGLKQDEERPAVVDASQNSLKEDEEISNQLERGGVLEDMKADSKHLNKNKMSLDEEGRNFSNQSTDEEDAHLARLSDEQVANVSAKLKGIIEVEKYVPEGSDNCQGRSDKRDQYMPSDGIATDTEQELPGKGSETNALTDGYLNEELVHERQATAEAGPLLSDGASLGTSAVTVVSVLSQGKSVDDTTLRSDAVKAGSPTILENASLVINKQKGVDPLFLDSQQDRLWEMHSQELGTREVGKGLEDRHSTNIHSANIEEDSIQFASGSGAEDVGSGSIAIGNGLTDKGGKLDRPRTPLRNLLAEEEAAEKSSGGDGAAADGSPAASYSSPRGNLFRRIVSGAKSSPNKPSPKYESKNQSSSSKPFLSNCICCTPVK